MNAENFIKSVPAGLAIYEHAWDKQTKEEHVVFLVKEKSEIIKQYNNPLIRVQLGIIKGSKSFPIIFMFMLNEKKDFIFDIWFNYCASNTKYSLDILSKQNFFYFVFYGDKGTKERTIALTNSIKNFFSYILKFMQKNNPSWSMEDFDEDKEKIYIKYPTNIELWQAVITSTNKFRDFYEY